MALLGVAVVEVRLLDVTCDSNRSAWFRDADRKRLLVEGVEGVGGGAKD